VFKKATRSRDKLFTVLCRASINSDPGINGDPRLGLAISKKHCRKATARNRIKRVIRESFRHNQEMLAGLDIVVINQPAASLAANSAMQESLERHWQRCSKSARKLTKQDS
jgi:ribonuclease P protein component